MSIIDNYPSTISQITLSKWIEWQNLYGNGIYKLKNKSKTEIDEIRVISEEAIKSISFFAGEDFEELSNDYDLQQIISLFIATQNIWNAEISNIKDQFPDGTIMHNNREYKVNGIYIPNPITFDFMERIMPQAKAFEQFIAGDWNNALFAISCQLEDLNPEIQDEVTQDFSIFESLTMDKVWYIVTIMSESFTNLYNEL